MKNLMAKAALLVGGSVFAGDTCNFDEVIYFALDVLVPVAHQIEVVSESNLHVKLFTVVKDQSGKRCSCWFIYRGAIPEILI